MKEPYEMVIPVGYVKTKGRVLTGPVARNLCANVQVSLYQGKRSRRRNRKSA